MNALPIPPDWPRDYPLEQEYSLELPLAYLPDAFDAPPRIGVMLHAFHVDLIPEFRAYLDHIPFQADLYVSSDTEAKCDAAGLLFNDWPKGMVEIRCMPNRGRDVAPKLVGFAAAHSKYDLVLHLHTKRSNHDSGLSGWRGYLLESLVGSAETVRGVLEAFRQIPSLGLIAPQQIDMLRPWIRWGDNYVLAETLAVRMGFPLPLEAPLDFPAGSMFWARPAALRPLFDLNLEVDEFLEEAGQTDGTLAHAIERLYFLACEHAGYDWMKIAPVGLLHDQRGVVQVFSPLGLQRFKARANVHLGDLREQRRSHGEHALLRTLPPRPLRPSLISWRSATGEDLEVAGRIAIVTPCSLDASASFNDCSTLKPAPGTIEAWFVSLAPDSGGNDLNAALRAGFAGGADIVLVQGRRGLLHPKALEALLQMSTAQHGRALIELSILPQFEPKSVEPGSFAIARAGGPALIVPREVFATVGELLDTPDADLAWQDYSARAVDLGFTLKLCPRALFFPTDDYAGWKNQL